MDLNGNLLIADPYGLDPTGTHYASDIVRVDLTTGAQTLVSSGFGNDGVEGLAVVPTPEPATLFLLTLGGLFLRKRKA